MNHAPAISRLLSLAIVVAILPLVAAGAETQDVTGTWTMTVETAWGSGNPTFTLTQEGESISGTYNGYFGEAPVSGTIKGDEVTLSLEVTAQGQDVKVDYIGAVEGDTMAGKVLFGGQGDATFKGTRKGE
jgi:hypothetical protein